MVVIAKSAGTSEIVAEHVEAVERRKTKTARPDARTEFRGVRRNPSGTYGAQIWDPSKRAMVWLGTFGTAEEAAGAYAAAAATKLSGEGMDRWRQRRRLLVNRTLRLSSRHACTPGWAAKKKKAAGRQDAAASPGCAAKKKKTAARPDAWTEFRGVHRMLSGKYGAQIRHPRAYDAAAVRLHGARAITNFKQSTATGGVSSCEEKDATAQSSGQAARSPSWMVKKTPHRLSLGSSDTAKEPTASAHDAAAVNLHGVAAQTSSKNPAAPALVLKKSKSSSRSGFRGVSVTQSGKKYRARIMDPVSRASRWLGNFDTAEEAAGAYDAAAVRLYGAEAITNFEQQPVAAAAAAAAAANDGEEEPSMDIPNDFFSDIIIPDLQLDDLWTDLPSAKEEQMVDEFLNMDFSDVVA
jgi:hypothetical protein